MAAKLGFEIVKQAMLKLLMKKGDDGIVLTLPKNEILDLNTRITMDRLIRNNIDPNSLTSPDQVINVLDNIDNANKPRVIPGTSAEGKAITEKLFGKKGEVIEFPQKRSFAEEIEDMKKSGDIVDPNNLKKNDKVLTREIFRDSNLNKPTIEGQMEKITGASNRIKEIQKEQAAMYKPKVDTVEETVSYIKTLEPMDAMKEANLVIGRKDKYKNLTPEESKKILKDTEDHIFERDIPDEDFATGGRAGFYTGGITDVEPSLDDIGHGSDSLMSRTRLMSPGAQATTSTGLNYLLAEDNDNLRIPFSKGKLAKEIVDKGRRGFMKAAGAAGAGIAALKTGLLGLGEKAAPVVETAVETAKETLGKYPPPYFFKLVDKIKSMGDDITEKAATQDREIVKKYKDYEMTEDVATGEIVIKKRNEGSFYDQDGIISDEYIVYKPGIADETTKGKPPPEYDEYTVRPDAEGKLRDSEDGLDSIDEILEEVGDPDSLTLKKADGGRIGFNKGKLVMEGGRRFLEKVFGKEKLKNIIENDPELEQGMLEIVDMFRKKDKEGLKMYLQKYLPHMDDVEIEDFIVGSGDTAGIEGQLIRLGSGRDYKGKIDMIEEANNMRKLEDFDIEGVSKNAEGGRIPYFKGGIAALKGILNYFAEQAGKKGSDQLKDINPKVLPSGIENIMGPEHMKMLKENQTGYLESLLQIIKSDKKFVDNVNNRVKEMVKTAPKGFEDVAENIANQMVKSSMKDKRFDRMKVYDKINIDDAIVDVEQMIKNRRVKESDGRALNASGGLQTMLGE
jgi:hypothetical protein